MNKHTRSTIALVLFALALVLFAIYLAYQLVQGGNVVVRTIAHTGEDIYQKNVLPRLAPSTYTSRTVGTKPRNIASLRTALSVATTTPYVRVIRVVDGDTIKIMQDNTKITVRLIGINTPETVDPRKPVECFGKEASAEAKKILTNTMVHIVTDPTQSKYDRYGRLLGYVFTQDGLFFNQYMITQGYAYEYTYQGRAYKYQQQFKQAERVAQQAQRGLWKSGVCPKS